MNQSREIIIPGIQVPKNMVLSSGVYRDTDDRQTLSIVLYDSRFKRPESYEIRFNVDGMSDQCVDWLGNVLAYDLVDIVLKAQDHLRKEICEKKDELEKLMRGK